MNSNLLTFDVEHWYEGFRYRGVDGWQAYPPRDDQMVERLLDKLAEAGQRSTMFFTGRYAEEFPHVVRRAAQEGHEIASHSYLHIVLSRMKGIDGFREDLLRSVKILEDISGCKIKGYRAPKWSITEKTRRCPFWLRPALSTTAVLSPDFLMVRALFFLTRLS
jgi:peptidoglycan/xylan/chitin deacetylase (PgdA/CDA1 family)